MDVTVTCKLDVSMKNHYSITNTESKSRLSDAKGLNEANIVHTSVERSIYCKGAIITLESLPLAFRNLSCHEAFKNHQKHNVKKII